MTYPIYNFYLFWLPKFFAVSYSIRGKSIIPYLSTVYALCGVGSILAGLLSSALIRRGWTINRARKTAMVACVCFTPFVILVNRSRDRWTATLLIGVALAAHQGISSMNYTTIIDMFPSRAVGSVFGIAACCGTCYHLFSSGPPETGSTGPT
jgi:MFS transporter, ACS family, hexuronate transporter